MSPTRFTTASLFLLLAGPAGAQAQTPQTGHEKTHAQPDFVVPENEAQVFTFDQKLTAEQEGYTAAALRTVAPSAVLPTPIGPKPPTHEELQRMRAAKFNGTFGEGAFEKITGFKERCSPPACNRFATVQILMGAHNFVDLKTEVEKNTIQEGSPPHKSRLVDIKETMREGIRTMDPRPGIKKEFETELNEVSAPIIKVVFTSQEREVMAQNTARRNDSAPSYANLGNTLQDTGKTPQAIEAYDTALAKDPRNEVALVGRAKANLALGNYAPAARDAGAALKVNPDNKVAHATLMLSQGRSQYRDGDGEGPGGASPAAFGGGAASAAQASPFAASGAGAKASTPAMTAKADGLTVEAKRHLAVGDPKAALAALTKAVESNPRNAQAHALASIAQNRLKDFPAALAAAQAGLKLAPNSPALLNSKAFALNRMKEYGGALAVADRALLLNPKDSMAHFNRAAALRGLGDRDGMLAALRSAARYDPKFSPILDAALKLPEDEDIFLLLPGEEKSIPNSSPGGLAKNWLPWAAAAATAVLIIGLLAVKRPSPAAPPPLSSSRPMPSLLCGKYEVGAEIGSGGMGVVYLGRDTSLERSVAIKRMREEIRWNQKERDRFIAEARLVAKLRHPNIVEIFEIVEQDGEVYLVFEHIAGKTLYELIATEKQVPFDRARDLIRGIASALDFAHGRKVIHRDLKPGNVMIDAEGRVRVMDFGIARLAREALSRQSTTGAIVGTPPYMAPEQEQGVTRPESDVYSMAACLYEALTGRLPFLGQSAGLLMNKINKNYVPSSKLVAGLPDGLDRIFARAFDPNPETRLSTAGAFLKELEKLAAPPRPV